MLISSISHEDSRAGGCQFWHLRESVGPIEDVEISTRLHTLGRTEKTIRLNILCCRCSEAVEERSREIVSLTNRKGDYQVGP